MELTINEEYQFYGLVESVNQTTYPTLSVVVLIKDNEKVTIRVDKNIEVFKGEIYHFTGVAQEFKSRIHIFITNMISLRDIDLTDNEKSFIRESLNQSLVIDYKECEAYLYKEISKIKNKVLREITKAIIDENLENFLVSQAAVKFHHSYKYGLLFHTCNMLKLSKGFINVYPHINEDLITSGIILHDSMKVKEMAINQDEYTKEGKLIGHIVLGTMEVTRAAAKLGYENEEETLLLSHIILSSHGESDFGSPKKPQIIEALIVHLCDEADAKIEPAVEALMKCKPLQYTDQVPSNDRVRFLKHKLSK